MKINDDRAKHFCGEIDTEFQNFFTVLSDDDTQKLLTKELRTKAMAKKLRKYRSSG